MFESIINYFQFSQSELNAISLSIKVAVVAIISSLPFAIFIAWLLARKEFWGKSILNGIVHLPLVLPPVVIGYLLLASMGRNGIIGKHLLEWFGFTFGFSWYGAALASAVVAFPLVMRSIRLALESVDFKLEQAARTLGASSVRVFFTITLPLSLPGILAGVILGFARSLGEFGSTITFVSNIPNVTQTIPLAMYSYIETPGAEDSAARLCIIAIIISLISLLLSEWLAKRTQQKLGQTAK
ncbi:MULTISPECIES: molybdate ABC transporter permease subunit [Pasteurellaceae]|uniref:Molybdenum transport system permease n=1 Tax=Pasteurella bettyae CCUG 2042 TaxID=1095749 RepID=I3DAT8_9PAST|nr:MULTISPECIES: molybdate ABC transporter permease subunit [Pasteurellaceae]EIJ68831.1 molybdate ABC transporter, permease protein [Pasteurella bettyae CCUG 2042]SUB20883.1 molybdate ABC transporter permease protein ModB [Pasteurella bettyae]